MLWKKNHTIRFLRDLPFFRTLTETDLASLLHAASIKNYPKNEVLFQAGKDRSRLFVILGGWVKLFRNTEEGDEAVIGVFTRGDMFGEASLFDDVPRSFGAIAIEDTCMMEISAASIREKMQTDPSILIEFMRLMFREKRRLQIENEHMAIMTAPQRAACLLLKLSLDMSGKGGTFSIPYGKSMAAAQLGMKPETFSRALAQLRRLGVSRQGAEVHIENFQDLAEYCCRHCSAGPEECRGALRKPCRNSFSEKLQGESAGLPKTLHVYETAPAFSGGIQESASAGTSVST